MTSIRLVLISEFLSVLVCVLFLLHILRNTHGTVNQVATSKKNNAYRPLLFDPDQFLPICEQSVRL
jgi:hypothetical protein